MSLQKVLISYEEYSRLKEIEKLYEELCKKQLKGKSNSLVIAVFQHCLISSYLYTFFFSWVNRAGSEYAINLIVCTSTENTKWSWLRTIVKFNNNHHRPSIEKTCFKQCESEVVVISVCWNESSNVYQWRSTRNNHSSIPVWEQTYSNWSKWFLWSHKST